MRKKKFGCPMCDHRFENQKEARNHIKEFDHLKKTKKPVGGNQRAKVKQIKTNY